MGCAGYVVWVAQAMWWFNSVVRLRLSQLQAWDWAWIWAELGNTSYCYMQADIDTADCHPM